MTNQEQQKIISRISRICFESALSTSKRIEQWADEKFGPDTEIVFKRDRGFLVQYQTEGRDEWFNLRTVPLPRGTMRTDESNRLSENVQNIFYWANLETSNELGDVSAVRFLPYITVDNKYHLKEDEAVVTPCTVTGEKREWNHLEIQVYSDPGWNKYDYSFNIDDIQDGDDLNWYLPWHFALEDDAVCPVAPIIVERADEFELVIRYRDQQYSLNMAPGKEQSVTLEKDVPVVPTHTWDGGRRPNYEFTLVLTISWREELYGSRGKESFQTKPHYVRTSDLPPGVRTMQQIDHDAWEYAVKNGLI